MMKQLKWLCYLKSLKLLLSTLLIGFFGFWVNSFVSAVSDGCRPNENIHLWWWIHSVWWTFTSSNSNSFDIWILNKFTVFTQSLWFWKKVFSPVESSLFWWGSDWLPYIYFNDDYQWVPNSYFICDSISDWNNFVSNCSKNELTFDSLPVLISFLSSVDSSDTWWYYYDNSTYYRYFNLCVSSTDFWKSLCFKFYTCRYNSSCPSSNCLLHNSNNYTNLTFASIPDSIIGDSPAVSSWWWDSWDSWDSSNDSNIPNYASIQSVYNSLFQQWYRSQMCYWWFAIDDILTSTNNWISNIKIWSGATVFELYDLYSWNDSFSDWYEDNYINYVYANEFSSWYVDSDFVWKSKWLIWLSIIRQAYWKKQDYAFNPSNFQYFCNLSLNFSWVLDSSSILSDLENSINQNVVNNIIKDIDFLTPMSWSALGYLVSNMCDSWNLTWDICWFSTVWKFANWDLFGNIKNSWAVWSLSPRWIQEGIVWILPTYIIIWFLWVLFLYYLRR